MEIIHEFIILHSSLELQSPLFLKKKNEGTSTYLVGLL